MEVTSASWWLAGAVVVAAIMSGAGLERGVLRRLAGDHRPVAVQQRSRRSAVWLSALVAVALAQVGVLAVSLAGIDWAAAPAGRAASTVAGALLLTSAVLAARAPRRAAPDSGPLAPALVAAAAQEVLFRGALLGWLLAVAGDPVPGRLAAVGVCAVAFGLSRLPRGRGATVSAAATGLVLGLAVVATGSVVVAVLGHVTLLLLVAATGTSTAHRTSATARTSAPAMTSTSRPAADGTAAAGCAGHDPQSPACAGCPLNALATPPATATANA